MKRQKITIDETLCVGCGQCTTACQHDVIALVDGKAKVLREDFCDGLGNCLPVCPTGAISFTEVEETVVKKTPTEDVASIKSVIQQITVGCPSCKQQNSGQKQWPLQIKLINVTAPFFADADLLIAADCCSYAYADFYTEFVKNRTVLIGCPKLDSVDYTEKLTAILCNNRIRSVLVARMQVPCCGGIERAVRQAVQNCGKDIPLRMVTITTEGEIL